MAEILKILGQNYQATPSLTDLYTVPAATQVVISALYATNICGASTTYRVSIASNGAADTTSQYVIYEAPLSSGEFEVSLKGVTIDATDKIRVYGSGVSFNLFGSELT